MKTTIICLILFLTTVYTQDLYKPNNLEGEVIYLAPKLSWEEPAFYVNNEWLIHWTESYLEESGIGMSDGSGVFFTQRFDTTMLSNFQGMFLENISFIPRDYAYFRPLVFEVEPNETPDLLEEMSNLILSGPLLTSSDLNLNNWNYIDLFNHDDSSGNDFSNDTTPSTYQIENSKELWFGYWMYNYTPGTWPGGVDLGPQIDGYGNMLIYCFNNGQTDTCITESLSDNNPYLSFNWTLGLYVSEYNLDDVSSFNSDNSNTHQSVSHLNIISELPSINAVLGKNQVSNSNIENTSSRDHQITYNIYENGEVITELNAAFWEMEYENEYVDLGERDFGTYEYFITAVYDTGESNPTNTISLEVFNTAPNDFNLLMPQDSTQFIVSATDLLNTLQFVWTISSDTDNQEVNYIIQLCRDQDSTFNCVDSTLSSNIFGIQFVELLNLLSIQDETSNVVWSVNATDGLDSTTALDGQFSFQLICEFLNVNDEEIPKTFTLSQCYPNPFNPTTQIKYNLPEPANVDITIYDMMGRVVKTLINDQQTAGYRSTQWNATNDRNEPVSAGLYLYTIQTGDFRQTKKMVLLK